MNLTVPRLIAYTKVGNHILVNKIYLCIFISFAVPPEKIHIYDDKRVDKTIILGPYNEGSDVNLLCEVKGGRLPLNFTDYQP